MTTKNRKVYFKYISQDEEQVRSDIEDMKKEISKCKSGPLGKYEREYLRECKSRLRELFKSLPMDVLYLDDGNTACCRCKHTVSIPKRPLKGAGKWDEYSRICPKCGQILRFVKYSDKCKSRRVSIPETRRIFKTTSKRVHRTHIVVMGFNPNSEVNTVSYVCGECKKHCDVGDTKCKHCGAKFTGVSYLIDKEHLGILNCKEVNERELNIRIAKFITSRTSKNRECPNCTYRIPEDLLSPKCCPRCGQHLIWSDTLQDSKDLLCVLSKDADKGIYIARNSESLGMDAIMYYCSELGGYTTDVACERLCSEYGRCEVVSEYLDNLKDL